MESPYCSLPNTLGNLTHSTLGLLWLETVDSRYHTPATRPMYLESSHQPDALLFDVEPNKETVGVYPDVDPSSHSVSLLWGREQKFRRRVSRAVSSMPLTLLRSNPRTAEGYDGRGMVTAMGILGRNKGLQPWNLVYSSDPQICSLLESSSTWTPRPSKVLRSFYRQSLWSQYHGLGDAFVDAAVELALLTLDIPYRSLNQWLIAGLEHQSWEATGLLARVSYDTDGEDGRSQALKAQYEASYVAMIISLNAMNVDSQSPQSAAYGRPELICTGLLMKARE